MERSGTPARAQELAQVRSSLASDGYSAVVVTGEPGIGKTTLWRAAVDHEEKLGRTVLIARPSEAESRLSYAGLSDLLGPLVIEGVDDLPPPQAHALRVALRLADTGPHPIDPPAVAAAALGLVRRASATTRLLLAVDDLQWLDAESGAVLEYVVRRVSDLPVHVLVSLRAGLDPPVVAALRGALESDRLLELRLGPLNLSGLHAVLLARTGTVPPHPVLTRITEQSRGNPLYALELASRAAAGSMPGTSSGSTLDGLTEVLRTQHLLLPHATRLLLAASAATARPDVDLLTAAGFGDVLDRVEPAERSGIAAVEGGAVVFTHPLFAAVALEACTAAERRSLHRRLATAVEDPEDRARHLAHAVAGRDASAAQAAEDAANHARLRGAPAAAAELALLSVERTSGEDPDVLARRQLLLGELLATAGDALNAIRVLTEASAAADAGVRVRALLVLARLANRTGPNLESLEIAARAVEASRGTRSEVGALTELALLCSATDPAGALGHARRALELALRKEGTDDVTLARARFAVMDSEIVLGGPFDDELARDLPSPDEDRSQPRVMDRVGYRVGNLLLFFDDMARTRAVLEASLVAVDSEGDEGSRPTVLDQLAQLEVIAGRWPLARTYAETQLDSALRASQDKFRAAAWETLASLDLREGDDSAARARLDSALEWTRDNQDPWEEAYALRTLGLLLLSRGDAVGALDVLSRVDRACDDFGVVAPGALRHHGDLIEALVEVGRPDEALERAADLDERGARCGSPMARASAARGRALALSRLGQLDGADDAAGVACAWGRMTEAPFELGRSLLTLGQIHRRRREKQLARTSLDEAASIFAELGSGPWSRRTAEEMSRLGLRVHSPRSLTATEEAVAALAATGASNPEIASQLHMSRKTVEFHLTKVFRKLDVRSRTELAARWSRIHAESAISAPPESTF